MKRYNEYMDSISVSPALHEKILARLDYSPSQTRSWSKAAWAGAGALLLLALIMLARPAAGPKPNKLQPNGTGPLGSTKTAAAEMTKRPLLNAAVQHDLAADQLIRQPWPGKVPFDYFCQNQLLGFANIDQADLSWQEAEFTWADLTEALGIGLKLPQLPPGDYTSRQLVLQDQASGKILAYQIEYLYFARDSLALQNRFSVFYLDRQYFPARAFSEMTRLRISGGKFLPEQLPEPSQVHFKLPHLQKLVIQKNDLLLVLEAAAEFVQKDGVLDQPASLTRYQELNQQLLDLAKSLF